MRKQLGVAPSASTDAATKTYVDTAIPASLATRNKDYYAAVGATFGPLFTLGGAGAPPSQQISGAAQYLYAGETVTNIVCNVQTLGVGTAPTALKLGVWSSAATPVCLAATADLASDSRWTTGGSGWKVSALSSPYAVTTSGIYYLSFWINGAFATTNLQIINGQANSSTSTAIGSSPRMVCTLKTSATTHAVSDTGTYGAAGSIPILGWS